LIQNTQPRNGSMSFLAGRRKHRTSSSLELAPLLDVLFLLIIFFSISSTFINESRFDIELPETGKVAGMSVSDTSVGVYVDRYGKLSVGVGVGEKEPITSSRLREKLSTVMLDHPETTVAIYGDKKVNYQSIVSVMDICRESGIKSISIVAIED
jgi:biopolymer transport protein ExbD